MCSPLHIKAKCTASAPQLATPSCGVPQRQTQVENIKSGEIVETPVMVKNAAKRSKQHAGKNAGYMHIAVCASSMNKSLDPTPI